jgi:hypothetical protein
MKPATTVAVILLMLIAIAHLIRLALRVEIVANGMVVPMWASALAGIVTAALAALVWREKN